jgi:hypothetical protein
MRVGDATGLSSDETYATYKSHWSYKSYPPLIPHCLNKPTRRCTRKPAVYPAFFPFSASVNHPPNIPKPPRGVIAPIQRTFVSARIYKEPLKTTKPANISQNASRGNGSQREITKRTTACTRLYNTPVCQIDRVPSASNRERNAWAPNAPKTTAKKPLKAATVLDK